MDKQKLNWWQGLLVIIVSVVFAALFTRFLTSDFSSLDIFAPIEKKVDFQVTDIYNMVEEKRQGRPISQDIIVVSVDECDREQLLTVIDTIASLDVKAIGLDIYFAIEKKDSCNARLKATIENTTKMVNLTMVEKVADKTYYRPLNLSFYQNQGFQPDHIGYGNLNADHSWEVIRTFTPYVLDSAGGMIPSLALEVASVAEPEKATRFIEDRGKEEIIDFTGKEIEVIPARRLAKPSVRERLQGKIVMIGIVEDNKDTYLTPLREPAAGILIHSYALQTILNDEPIVVRAAWIDWLIAIGLGLILVIMLFFATECDSLRYVLNFGIRLSLFVCMYLLVYRGCDVFADSHVYADYTPSIMMLPFATLAFDIVYAAVGFIVQCYQKFNPDKSC